MNARDQLKVLSKIWGNTRGYVFLPWIPKDRANIDKKTRRAAWQEQAYQWPLQKGAIMEHLAKHVNDELYFAPTVFSKADRQSEYALTGRRLWADLDEANPEAIDPALVPTIAWKTSPDRYAAVWLMNSERENVTAPGNENHRLTLHLGADPSGWDTTQLLRVPGSANNKPGYPEGTRGELLWADRGFHDWSMVDTLPGVPEAEVINVENLDEQMLGGVDRHAVWGRAKMKVSPAIRQFMRLRSSDGHDRSEVAWQIERELADAGCSMIEIVAIIRPTVWNKYAGRRDELKRLMTEATKALQHKVVASGDDPLEPEVERPDLVPFWDDTEYITSPPPDWLVNGLIPEGGCGFIAGIPKSMKSWLALDLAISVSWGKQFLTEDVRPQHVLYIQEEDAAPMVRDRHRIIATSKDPQFVLDPSNPTRTTRFPRGLYMYVLKGYDGADPGWQSWLMDTVQQYDIGLVIFDTMSTVASGVDGDKANDVKQKFLDPIKDMARTTGATVLIVHHMNKARGSERAGQNMAGSGQIHAWADFGFYILEKNDKLLTFDHETKYTGTTRITIDTHVSDDTWNPTPHTVDGEGAPKNDDEALIMACMTDYAGVQRIPLEQLPADPLCPPDIQSNRKRMRRIAMWMLELHDPAMTIDDVAAAMGTSTQTARKYVEYVGNDYPPLKRTLTDV